MLTRITLIGAMICVVLAAPRDGLMSIYTTCGGSAWSSVAVNWGSSSVSYCSWGGVTCSNSGVGPDVFALALTGFGLVCDDFPWGPALSSTGDGLGDQLQLLDLSYNPQLQGTLPVGLPLVIPSIVSLTLAGTPLSGTLSTVFSSAVPAWLQQVQILDVSSMPNLVGTIPAAWSTASFDMLNISSMNSLIGTFDAVYMPPGAVVDGTHDSGLLNVFYINGSTQILVTPSDTSTSPLSSLPDAANVLPLGLYSASDAASSDLTTTNSFRVTSSSVFAGPAIPTSSEIGRCLLTLRDVGITTPLLIEGAYISHYMYLNDALSPCIYPAGDFALVQPSYSNESLQEQIVYQSQQLANGNQAITIYDYTPLYELVTNVTGCATWTNSGGKNASQFRSSLRMGNNLVTLTTVDLSSGAVISNEYVGEVLVNATVPEGLSIINSQSILDALHDGLPVDIANVAGCALYVQPSGNSIAVSCPTGNPLVWSASTCNTCLWSSSDGPTECSTCFTLPQGEGVVQVHVAPHMVSDRCYWSGTLDVNDGVGTVTLPPLVLPCTILSAQAILVVSIQLQSASSSLAAFLWPYVANGIATETSLCPSLMPWNVSLCGWLGGEGTTQTFYSFMVFPTGTAMISQSDAPLFAVTAVSVSTNLTVDVAPGAYSGVIPYFIDQGDDVWLLMNVTGFLEAFQEVLGSQFDNVNEVKLSVPAGQPPVLEMMDASTASVVLTLSASSCDSRMASVVGAAYWGVQEHVTSYDICTQGEQFVLATLELRQTSTGKDGSSMVAAPAVTNAFTLRNPNTQLVPHALLELRLVSLNAKFLWLSNTLDARQSGRLASNVMWSSFTVSQPSVCLMSFDVVVGSFCLMSTKANATNFTTVRLSNTSNNIATLASSTTMPTAGQPTVVSTTAANTTLLVTLNNGSAVNATRFIEFLNSEALWMSPIASVVSVSFHDDEAVTIELQTEDGSLVTLDSNVCDPCLAALWDSSRTRTCSTCLQVASSSSTLSFVNMTTDATVAAFHLELNFGASPLPQIPWTVLGADAIVMDPILLFTAAVLPQLLSMDPQLVKTFVPLQQVSSVPSCPLPITMNGVFCSANRNTTLVFTSSGQTFGGKVLQVIGNLHLANVSVLDPLFPVIPQSREVANATTFVTELFDVLPDVVQQAVREGFDFSVHYGIDNASIIVVWPNASITLSYDQCDACVAPLLAAMYDQPVDTMVSPCVQCRLSTDNTLLQSVLSVEPNEVVMRLGLLDDDALLVNHTWAVTLPLTSADAFPTVGNSAIIVKYVAGLLLRQSNPFFSKPSQDGDCPTPIEIINASWCAMQHGYYVSVWVNESGMASFVTNGVASGVSRSTALTEVEQSRMYVLHIGNEQLLVNHTQLATSIMSNPRWYNILGFVVDNLTFMGNTSSAGIIVQGPSSDLTMLIEHSACDSTIVAAMTTDTDALLSYCYYDANGNIFTLNITGGLSPSVVATSNGVIFTDASELSPEFFIFNATALLTSLIVTRLPSLEFLPELSEISCADAVVQPVVGVFCDITHQTFTTIALGDVRQAVTAWDGTYPVVNIVLNSGGAWMGVGNKNGSDVSLLNASGFMQQFGRGLGINESAGCRRVTISHDTTELHIECDEEPVLSFMTSMCDSSSLPLMFASTSNTTSANVTSCSLNVNDMIPVEETLTSGLGFVKLTAITTGSHGAVAENHEVPLIANLSILFLKAPSWGGFPVAAVVLASNSTVAIGCSNAKTDIAPPSTLCGQINATTGNQSVYWTFITDQHNQSAGGLVAVTTLDTGIATAMSAAAPAGSFTLRTMAAYGGAIVNQSWFTSTFVWGGFRLAQVTLRAGELRAEVRGYGTVLFTSSGCNRCLADNLNGSSAMSTSAVCETCVEAQGWYASFAVNDGPSGGVAVRQNFASTQDVIPFDAFANASVVAGTINVYHWEPLMSLSLTEFGSPIPPQTIQESECRDPGTLSGAYCATTSASLSGSMSIVFATETLVATCVALNSSQQTVTLPATLFFLPWDDNQVANGSGVVLGIAPVLQACIGSASSSRSAPFNGSIQVVKGSLNQSILISWSEREGNSSRLFSVQLSTGQCDDCLGTLYVHLLNNESLSRPMTCTYCAVDAQTLGWYSWVLHAVQTPTVSIQWQLQSVNSSSPTPFTWTQPSSRAALPMLPIPRILLTCTLKYIGASVLVPHNLSSLLTDNCTLAPSSNVSGHVCAEDPFGTNSSSWVSVQFPPSLLGGTSPGMVTTSVWITATNPTTQAPTRTQLSVDPIQGAFNATTVHFSTAVNVTAIVPSATQDNASRYWLTALSNGSVVNPSVIAFALSLTLGLDVSWSSVELVLNGSIISELTLKNHDQIIGRLTRNQCILRSPPPADDIPQCLLTNELSLVQCSNVVRGDPQSDVLVQVGLNRDISWTFELPMQTTQGWLQPESAVAAAAATALATTLDARALYVTSFVTGMYLSTSHNTLLLPLVRINCSVHGIASTQGTCTSLLTTWSFGKGALLWVNAPVPPLLPSLLVPPAFLCSAIVVSQIDGVVHKPLCGTGAQSGAEWSVVNTTLYPVEPQWSTENSTQQPLAVIVSRNTTPGCLDAAMTLETSAVRLETTFAVMHLNTSAPAWLSNLVPVFTPSSNQNFAGLLLNQTSLRRLTAVMNDSAPLSWAVVQARISDAEQEWSVSNISTYHSPTAGTDSPVVVAFDTLPSVFQQCVGNSSAMHVMDVSSCLLSLFSRESTAPCMMCVAIYPANLFLSAETSVSVDGTGVSVRIIESGTVFTPVIPFESFSELSLLTPIPAVWLSTVMYKYLRTSSLVAAIEAASDATHTAVSLEGVNCSLAPQILSNVAYCGWYATEIGPSATWASITIMSVNDSLILATRVDVNTSGVFPFNASHDVAVRATLAPWNRSLYFETGNSDGSGFLSIDNSVPFVAAVRPALPGVWSVNGTTARVRLDGTGGLPALAFLSGAGDSNLTFTTSACSPCLVELMRSITTNTTRPATTWCTYGLLSSGNLALLDWNVSRREESTSLPSLVGVLSSAQPLMFMNGSTTMRSTILWNGTLAGDGSQASPMVANPVALLLAANASGLLPWVADTVGLSLSAPNIVPLVVMETSWKDARRGLSPLSLLGAGRSALCTSDSNNALFVALDITVHPDQSITSSLYVRYVLPQIATTVSNSTANITLVGLLIVPDAISEMIHNFTVSNTENGGMSSSEVLALLGVLARSTNSTWAMIVQQQELFAAMQEPLQSYGSQMNVTLNSTTCVAVFAAATDDDVAPMQWLAFVSTSISSGRPVGTTVLNLTSEGDTQHCTECLLSSYTNQNASAACAESYYFSQAEALYYEIVPGVVRIVGNRLLPELQPQGHPQYTSKLVIDVPQPSFPWFGITGLTTLSLQVPQVQALVRDTTVTNRANITYTIIDDNTFCYSYEDLKWTLSWEATSSSVTLTRFETPSDTNVVDAVYPYALAYVSVEGGQLLADAQGMATMFAAVFPGYTSNGMEFGHVTSGSYSTIGAVQLTFYDSNRSTQISFAPSSTCKAVAYCGPIALMNESLGPETIASRYDAGFFGSSTVHSVLWSGTGAWATAGFAREGVLMPLAALLSPSVPASVAPCGSSSAPCRLPCISATDANCSNVAGQAVATFLYSYLTTGNTTAMIDLGGACDADRGPQTSVTSSSQERIIAQAALAFARNPMVRLQCTDDGSSVIMSSAPTNDSNTDIFLMQLPSTANVLYNPTTSSANGSYFGVSMECTSCIPYLHPSNNPQPIFFLLIGAIKTLGVTLLAFYVARSCSGVVERIVQHGIGGLTASLARIDPRHRDAFKRQVLNNYLPARCTNSELRARIRAVVEAHVAHIIKERSSPRRDDAPDEFIDERIALLKNCLIDKTLFQEFVLYYEDHLADDRRRIPKPVGHTAPATSSPATEGSALLASVSLYHDQWNDEHASSEVMYHLCNVCELVAARALLRQRRRYRSLKIGGLRSKVVPRDVGGVIVRGPLNEEISNNVEPQSQDSILPPTASSFRSQESPLRVPQRASNSVVEMDTPKSVPLFSASAHWREMISGRLPPTPGTQAEELDSSERTTTRTTASTSYPTKWSNDDEDAWTAVATALKEATAAANEVFDAETTSFDRVLLTSRLLDDALTPVRWILVFDGLYCIVLFFVSLADAVDVASQQPWMSHWMIYEILYFKLLNSSSSASFLVSSWVACTLQRVPLRSSKTFILSVMLVAPPFITHVAPAMAVFSPLLLLPLGGSIAFEYWTRRRYAVHYHDEDDNDERASTHEHSDAFLPEGSAERDASEATAQSKHDAERRQLITSFAVRAMSRVLINFIGAVVLSMGFNLAILYVYHRGDAGNPTSYGDIIVVEFTSRNLVCTINSIGSSVANVMQSMSSIGPALF